MNRLLWHGSRLPGGDWTISTRVASPPFPAMRCSRKYAAVSTSTRRRPRWRIAATRKFWRHASPLRIAASLPAKRRSPGFSSSTVNDSSFPAKRSPLENTMSADYPRPSQTDLRRLEKLASDAGRTPRAMLKFVLRDGFAETERVVRAVQLGRDDVAAGRTRPHAAIMSRAEATLSCRGKPLARSDAREQESIGSPSMRSFAA
jgi:predicted transcriptional regulator